jgi:hypothetical protein
MTDRSGNGLRVSPVVANRHLLRRFVQARHHAGFASRELAADALHWSPRKQALLESGDQPIPLRDLDVILPAFKVPEDQWPLWREQAELARARGWWDSYDEADLSSEGKLFVGYEWGARRIRSFDGSIMPALLQIPGYTEAALAAGVGARPPEQINRLLAVRRQRQRALGQPDPLEYEVVLDEAALRRPGGSPDTMRAQLNHVLDLAETRKNITVQVVPFSAGLYPAQSGTFVIMEFGVDDEDAGLVHVEPGFTGSLYMEERNEIYLYSRVFQRLLEIALSPIESMDLIRSVIADTKPASSRRRAAG